MQHIITKNITVDAHPGLRNVLDRLPSGVKTAGADPTPDSFILTLEVSTEPREFVGDALFYGGSTELVDYQLSICISRRLTRVLRQRNTAAIQLDAWVNLYFATSVAAQTMQDTPSLWIPDQLYR